MLGTRPERKPLKDGRTDVGAAALSFSLARRIRSRLVGGSGGGCRLSGLFGPSPRLGLKRPSQTRRLGLLMKVKCKPLTSKEMNMKWETPTLVEICIGLEINGYLPAEF
jgi:coenzyme PQQ precursor peptide PqqA